MEKAIDCYVFQLGEFLLLIVCETKTRKKERKKSRKEKEGKFSFATLGKEFSVEKIIRRKERRREL